MAAWCGYTGWLAKSIGGSGPNSRMALAESVDTTGMPDACVATVAIVVYVSREFMCVVPEGTLSAAAGRWSRTCCRGWSPRWRGWQSHAQSWCRCRPRAASVWAAPRTARVSDPQLQLRRPHVVVGDDRVHGLGGGGVGFVAGTDRMERRAKASATVMSRSVAETAAPSRPLRVCVASSTSCRTSGHIS